MKNQRRVPIPAGLPDKIVIVAMIIGLGIFINLFTVLNPWSDVFTSKNGTKAPKLTANIDEIASADEVWTEIVEPKKSPAGKRVTSNFRDAISDPALKIHRTQRSRPQSRVNVTMGNAARKTDGQAMPVQYTGDVVYINEREGREPLVLPGRLPRAVAAPNPPSAKHTVKKGETLSSIASKYYGTGSQWTRIKEANAQVLSKSKWLIVGTNLVIPGTHAIMKTSVAQRTEPAQTPTHRTTNYTIKRGDTLTKIARAIYGNSNHWRKIQKANPGINPRAIVPGKQLVIPL